MSIENQAQYFHTIEDPHCGGKIEHRLRDILVIAVCAVIACAESCGGRDFGLTRLAQHPAFPALDVRIVRRAIRLLPGQHAKHAGQAEHAVEAILASCVRAEAGVECGQQRRSG